MILLLCLFMLIFPNDSSAQKIKNNSSSSPNIIIILADDLGYGDVGFNGARGYSTPNIDRMANEGIRFTDFLTSASICSPTRASLLTGCYGQRLGIPSVIGPNSNYGIHPREQLLPEILKEKNYSTALFGKWHIGGSNPVFSPLQNGFDEFLGTIGSNDLGSIMSPQARKLGLCGLELYEGNRVISTNPDQGNLTKWYTEAAVDFIKRKYDKPFFIYLAYNMPHTPIAVSDNHRYKTESLYGDVIKEIDWSVGEILGALKDYNIDENTIVVFTSDNGPWLIFGEHGGSAFPFRGGKKESTEGGFRVPCVMRWPGKIPAGEVRTQMVTIMDILPTMAFLADAKLPDQQIDGHNIWSIIIGEINISSPYSAFYYYYNNELRAIRSGQWKLYFSHVDSNTPDPARIGILGYRGKVMPKKVEKSLYHLSEDVQESKNIAFEHPDIVEQLDSLASIARLDLGDGLSEVTGKGVRSALIIRK